MPLSTGMLQGEIRLVKAHDIEDAYKLETEGYPQEEAASYEALLFRQKEASDLFIGYYEDHQLMGFITGTRHHGSSLSEDSMSEHMPQGENVCIHSVCVAAKCRRKGVALTLLKDYKKHVTVTQEGVRRILLICHAELIPLYTRAGFTFLAKSTVTHGKRPWFEMEYAIPQFL